MVNPYILPMEKRRPMLAKGGFKTLLVLEALFAGIYIALTRGLLFVYLVSVGSGVEGISVVVGVSALVTVIVHIFYYKYPRLLVSRVKPVFTAMHALERVLFIFVPFTQDPLMISGIFAVINCLPTGAYMYLVIYGSLSEDDIKDVTAKRMASFGATSIIGFALAMILVAFLPPEVKFIYIYLLGSLVGLVCTLCVALMKTSHLEGMAIPKGIKEPEKLFSTSYYFIAVLASGNLLTIVWVPYLMNHLNGPDYLAVSMSLVGTFASVVASLLWKGRTFKTLRSSVVLDGVAPALALSIPMPILHPALFGFSSFMYTGSNFVGNFLFAEYNRWLGAIRSSLLLVIILNVAQAIIAPVGLFIADYFLLFSIIIGIKVLAIVLVLIAIPRVAMVSEENARTYSSLLYENSMVGYRVSVEISKDTILTTLRLIGLLFIFLLLYIIYRTLFLMFF